MRDNEIEHNMQQYVCKDKRAYPVEQIIETIPPPTHTPPADAQRKSRIMMKDWEAPWTKPNFMEQPLPNDVPFPSTAPDTHPYPSYDRSSSYESSFTTDEHGNVILPNTEQAKDEELIIPIPIYNTYMHVFLGEEDLEVMDAIAEVYDVRTNTNFNAIVYDTEYVEDENGLERAMIPVGFVSPYLNVGTIAHECSHIAARILSAKGISSDGDSEPFCYLLQYLVQTLYEQLILAE